MDDTLTANRRRPLNVTKPSPKKPQPENIIPFVAIHSRKTTKNSRYPFLEDVTPSQANLIILTEKLAEAARNGTLAGLGGFAEFEDGTYIVGLEGTYLTIPGSAALPLLHLQKRLLNQIPEDR